MKISLKASHIHLDNEIVNKVLKNIEFVFVVYVKETNRLMIAPSTSTWFAKMYEPSQFLLKTKNLLGDKAIAVKPILIDYDLNMTDRILSYEVIEKTKLIKINLDLNPNPNPNSNE